MHALKKSTSYDSKNEEEFKIGDEAKLIKGMELSKKVNDGLKHINKNRNSKHLKQNRY